MNTIFDIMPFFNTIGPINIGIITSFAIFFVIIIVFRFVIHADDEEARSKGRKAIFWGIVGVFLLLSFWGLVRILLNTIKLPGGPPQINSGGLVPQYNT